MTYFGHTWKACMQIVTPADKFVAAAQHADSIARGACHVAAAMFQNVPLRAVEAAVGVEKVAEGLRAVAQVTVDLVRAGGAAVDNCTSWEGVCTGAAFLPCYYRPSSPYLSTLINFGDALAAGYCSCSICHGLLLLLLYFTG